MRVTATSSNSSLIADPTVIYTSAESTGQLKFAPLGDQNGVTTITVTVEDGGLDNDLATLGDNTTTTVAFEVNVRKIDGWHNKLLPNDVNNDKQVSPLDALYVINYLNIHGSHVLPEIKPKDSVCLDVDNDQWISPSDALHVVNHLNVHSYYVGLGVVPYDGIGNPIDTVVVGEIFYLTLVTEDLRPDAEGVFAAYADVYYPTNSLTTVGSISYDEPYLNGRSGDLGELGLIDEWGAFAGLTPTNDGRYVVSRVPMRATKVGILVFGASPADQTPSHDVLLFGSEEVVAPEFIRYLASELLILEEAEGEGTSLDIGIVDDDNLKMSNGSDEVDRFFERY
jgi:hypothetical protein